MDVIYRVCPKLSETCVNWIDNKKELIFNCLSSFLKVKTLDIKIYFLVDQMDGDYLKPYGEVYKINHGTKRGSIEAMLDLATNLTNPEILFLEDDYLWREDTNIEELITAIKYFGAVTPYDHPDHYYHPVRKFHHIEPYRNRLYRNCITTTHTFGIRRDIFIKNREHFNYGEQDWQMWTKLDLVGVTIWSPVESMASHLAQGHLAIGYDYKKLYEKIKYG
jgi:hypothetical protein